MSPVINGLRTATRHVPCRDINIAASNDTNYQSGTHRALAALDRSDDVYKQRWGFEALKTRRVR